MILFLYLGLGFLLVSIALGYYFYRIAFFPKVFTVQKTREIELENGRFDEAEFLSWPREQISIRSPHGYTLSGEYFPYPGSDKTVILSHGITYSWYGQIKYMHIFRNLGYNLLAYDLRFHGNSGGSNCSFGYFEKHDLRSVVDFAFSHLSPLGKVGTQGESLGAAVTLQHAAIDPRIAFAIPDCSFSDLQALFTYRMEKDYHLPPFPLLNIANTFSSLLNHFSIQNVSPLRDVPRISAPILFIHGQADTYIPPNMSLEMYQAASSGLKRLYLVPGARHAGSLITDPSAYEKVVKEFILAVEQTWCKKSQK